MKNLRQHLAILTLLFLTAASSIANAATYYNFQITEGTIETSGGVSGSGYGSFDLMGSFGITFTDIDSSVAFSNISVYSTEANEFEFPNFDGIYAGGYILGSAPGATYNGFFDGDTLTLSGSDIASCCDQYNHSFDLTATTVVPLPAAFWLFFSSLGVLSFFKSRRNT